MSALKDKHVLVTGVSHGLGRATAEACLDAGARVTGVDVTAVRPAGVNLLQYDVGEAGDWREIIRRVEAPHHLFLNAGIMSAPNGSPPGAYGFDRLTVERYRRVIRTNIDGVVLGLTHCLPGMSEGSSVVVTASLAGLYAYPHDPVYSMTKHAVVGLVKSVAPALAARGIRINAICPNRIDTALLPLEMRHRDSLDPRTVAQDVVGLFAVDGGTGNVWERIEDAGPLRRVDRPAGPWRRLGRRLKRSWTRR